jgi:hypothetical protein
VAAGRRGVQRQECLWWVQQRLCLHNRLPVGGWCTRCVSALGCAMREGLLTQDTVGGW